jgi:TfoX/Sxy family transcriptional regulator of competence genes
VEWPEGGLAYDEDLAQRIRKELADEPRLVEKKMFGGIGFLLDGNMACGVHGDDLIVRVGPARNQDALAQRHARVFDMTGRPMVGWVEVDPAGVASAADLRRWVMLGVEHARTLPPK